ncbi:BrnA antitoxin family protein [Mesorhizobium sp. B2-7-1]|uniref:BrnA antitoxin family protein n=1 Tax=Mesorhizobium sp. B2-7-1 TaxID=2589909 RepID=UPI0011279442|nr:BrnA antitoxin family protein [Mesorhizobium sp. B2-7-1]TPJ73755.1 BrnA antitoxin family protein [Mesorhizobium sp. B2-7-1]
MSRKDLSQDQRHQLAKLADLPDDQIDTLDIPEVPAENWAHARGGEFYRPLKQPVTIRLDADVLAWFREHVEKGGGYQTEINRVLRRYVMEQERRRS